MVTSTKVYIAFILATSAVLGVILVNRIYNSSQHFEPPVTGTDFQLTEIQISQYKVEASQGNTEAMWKLYNFYSMWLEDDKSAEYWLQQAAKAGDKSAQDIINQHSAP
jgi:hypothetical protein